VAGGAPEALDDAAAIARLLAGGLAGPHRSHARESNVANAGRLASGHPDYTFGMAGVVSASAEEALAAVAALTGAREPGDPYIDPAATLAGVRRAAGVLAEACAAGRRILVATGHPTGLLVHHVRLARAIAAAGGTLLHPLDDRVAFQDGGRKRVIRYFGGVAALTDGANVLHSHLPDAMEAMLAAGPVPELVFADHGYAGAAVARGIPAIAVMDTNDPALAVACSRGADLTIIPMDDNRRPDSYDVIADLFERRLGGSGG
jgi:hypothetical protein